MPYRVIENVTLADVAFEAWGAGIEEMFLSCADALLSVLIESPHTLRSEENAEICLEKPAMDLLLHAFLEELVFLKDTRGLLLHPEKIGITSSAEAWRLECTAKGECLDRKRHRTGTDVKGVSFHNFAVACQEGTWRATFVLDV